MTTEEIEALDDEQYDVEAIKIDQANGNFDGYAEPYRHEVIVRMSLINGQFKQARTQCENYGLSFQIEHFKFRHNLPALDEV